MGKCKIKIAVLELKYPGALTSVNDLVASLDKDKFEAMFCYLSNDGPAENHFAQAGFKVCYLSSIKRFNAFRFSVLMKLVRVLKENDIDILHCHAHKSTIYGALAGLFIPKLKIIAHVHGLGRSARLRRKLTNSLIYRRLNRILCVAQAVKQDLLKNNWLVPDSKITVLPNSIDYHLFADAPDSNGQIRKQSGLPDEAFVFAMIGRLDPTKGISYLIDAFVRVRAKSPSAHLVFVGRGASMSQYQKQVRELSLSDSVHFLGYRKDIPALLKAMDAFVLASVREGMPRVILEAMAAGVPCIATAVGGIPEIITDDETGFLVKPGDSEALADAMSKIIDMPLEKRKQIGENSTQRVKTFYSHDVIGKKLEEIYSRDCESLCC